MNKRVLIFSTLLFLLAGRPQAQVAYTENSGPQFDAGTHNFTYVSASEVMLDHYGRGAGLSAPAADAWYNPAWTYRLALSVDSANGSTLSAYPVAVTVNTQALIAAGRMNADGSDLRFTTAAVSGSPALLPYYIESGLNSASTRIWVKHSGISAGSNGLYMYYGSTSAAAASSMPGVYLLGDNFTGANGAAPSSSTWVSVNYGTPGAGSTRDIQANQLRILFGSPLGTRYYGLRSSNQYSFAAGRQYRADLVARTGTDSWSSLTLCQSVYTYTYDQDDWLRVAVHHSPSGASYALERSDSGIKTTLASGPLADGTHAVNLLVSASSFTVLLDGAQIYSAANTLAFNSPYLYLEAASAASSLEEFLFDNVSVQPYSAPEPAFGSAGAEQGRRYPSGYFLSQVRDTSSTSRFNRADWLDLLPQGSSVTLQARAHDTNIALASFSTVTKGGDPNITGRYVQYRLNFSASDPRYTASVSSVTLGYGSVPLAPTGGAGAAQSESSIRWTWTDNSSGQYQEDGFKIFDASGSLKGSVGTDIAEWTETGLYPNTQYSRAVGGYNAAGTGATAAMAKYTLPLPPSVSCDKSTGTWLSGPLTCINLSGFGANGVAYYRYEWNQQPTKTWSGAETQWLSGSLSKSDFFTGNYYLHVKSYNGDNVALAGYQTYGPFWYDKNVPTVTGFSPSSAPWQNTFVNPAVSFADTGGSKLYRARYRFTTSADRPATGWQAYNYSISGDSGTISSYTQSFEGQWYLHIEVEDVAGNVGYSYSGFGLPAGSAYKIDTTNPSGSININSGDAYTASPNVTLNLTYADGAAGVKTLGYKNVGAPGNYIPELPQATSAWILLPGDALKTVSLQVTDNAGNTQQYTKTITLDSRTALQGSAVGAAASGVMGEPAESFTAAAALSWAPTAAALSGKTVSFYFNGSTQTAVTSALGAASVDFAVPAASGPYIYNISFSTDGVYAASASTGVLTAAQRSTTLITEDVNGTSNNPFIAKATLKDLLTSSLITGATVTFYFEGSTQTAVTNAVGVATVTFTAPVPVSFYDYTAVYDGSPVYAAQNSVSRLGVGLRVTSLAVSPVTSPAGAVFNAQATLLDGVTPVEGSTITFVFQGSSNTAFTNASGVAIATFTAPASSGTYSYSGAFPGDGTYAASSGNSALTATRRPLSLVGETAQGYVNATFTARATLSDGINAQRVPGKAIVFVFEGSSLTMTTDALGVSTAVFSAGALARGASCYYYFAGDSGYNSADSTGTIAIEKRPVSLAASDLAGLVGSSFTATAQLKDAAFTPVGIAGKELIFSFGGSTQSVFTDSLGVASVTYQAGVSTGAYDYYVSFAQDSVYVAGSDTGTVTLDKRPTVLSAFPRFVFALDSIQALADLKDGITGEYISSQTISFNYAGIFQSTVTGTSGGNAGRAYSVYAGTGVAGTYSFSATFQGTALYSANSSTASITVTQRSVNLTAFPLTAIWGTTFTATAEFRDGATNSVVNGKILRLAFSTVPAGNFVTAGAGVASSTFSAPASTGTFSWFANFAGDAAYAPAASTGTLTVNRRPPTLTPIASSRYVWDSIYLSATFTDEGNPISGKQLSFYFNGSTLTATTNAGGIATSAAFSSMSVQGVYGFSVQFAGDTNYSAQSGSSTVTVNRRLSNVNVGPLSAIANSTVTLSATLVDTSWGTGISGKIVSFTLQNATHTLSATTNASGIASVVYQSSGVTGPYTYSATFAGNTNYSGTSSSETLTVTRRPAVLEMSDYYPPANSTFTAYAVLKDFTTGAQIASKTLSFLFRTSTQTALTNAVGYGATNYYTVSSTATLPITVSFAGDALYSAASVGKTVYPGRRNTALQTSDILTAVAKDTFTVTARLSDYDLGTFLANSTVTFSFSGSTYTLNAFTNSTGIASVQFAAPPSTGTYTYSASFAGSALYNGTMETSSVLVNRRTAAINPSDLTGVPAVSTFTASALFADGALTLSTKTLTFVFVSSKNAVTSGVGVATASFIAPLSTGTFIYKVTYNGDALYNPATAYATIGVVLKPTVLEVLDVPDAVVGLKFTGTAKLRDIEAGNALVIATKTITISFRPFAVTYTSAAVSAAGVSTAAFVAPLSTGTYGYTAVFAGDGVYGASTSSGTVTVNRRPVLFSLVSDPVSPHAYRANAINSSFTVTATLSDGQVAGLNLAGQSVTFVFQNSTKTATTNALGLASTTFASPASSGTYSYFGYFYGDNSYNPNRPEDSEKSINIIQRPTNILPRDSLSGLLNIDGSPNPYYTFWKIGVQSRIIDTLSGQGVLGVTANFVLNGSTITGLTDSIGTAVSSSPFPGVTNYGTYPAIVRFDGNGTYGPSILPGSTNLSDPYTAKIRIHQSPAGFDVPQITETYPDADTVLSGNVLDWWNRPVSYADRIDGNPNAALVGYPITYQVSTIPCGADCGAVGRNWAITGTGFISATNIASATVRSPVAAGDYPIQYWFNATNSFTQWGLGGAQRVLRVGRRLTYIIPDAEPFTAGAQIPIDLTLKLADLTQSLAGVNGKDLEVVLVTTQTLVTGTGGGVGKVKATFPGLAVGTYTYIARFADGDPAYMPFTSSGTVIVEKNTTVLSADDVSNVPAGNSFIAKATLNISSGVTNTPLPGKTINFVFTSTAGPTIDLTAVTNSIGVATVTYWAPYVPFPNYNYTATFVEDANNKGSADNANNVQVVKRRTQTTAQDVPQVYIQENFVSTATLVDLDLGNSTVPAKTISFVFHRQPDVNGSRATNALGVSSFTFSAPVSSGVYQYSATFPGDSVYALSSDTRTVTSLRRVTYIDAVDITTPTNNAFTITATLSDVTFNLGVSTPLAGLQVRFVFNGSTLYGTTAANGKASVSFTAPATAAFYPYSANFDGSQVFNVTTTNRQVEVRKRQTFVSGTDVTAPSGAQFTASASLIDEFGQKLQGYTLDFVFTGAGTFNGSGVTDVNGQTSALFTAPLSTGNYNYTAAFAGDATYEASADPVNAVTVNVASTTLSVPDGSIVVNNTYYSTATLLGAISGVGVESKLISFTYDGALLGQNATDINGKAVRTFIPTSTGTFRLDAVFSGDTAFYAASASATITVTRRTSSITLQQPVNTEVGAVFLATATLKDYTNALVAGRTIDFMFNGTPKTAVTNALGVATVTYNGPTPGGTTYPLTISFAGDTVYTSTNNAGIANVAKRVTQISVDNGSVSALEVFNATATLRWNGTPVAGKILYFNYKGSGNLPAPATDVNGQTFLQFSAGASSGPWRLDGAFTDGADPDYTTISGSGTITVLRRSCVVAPSNISMSVYDAFTASATFRDAANLSTPAGKVAKLSFNWMVAGSTFTTGASDASGLVTVSTGAPSSSGTYKVEGFFLGDATYAPSLASTATVTVTRRPTSLSVADAAAYIDRVFTATATLANNGTQLNNKYVLFTFEGRNFNAKTGAAGAGIAVATFTVTISTGLNRVDAVFNGDASYEPSAPASATVTAAMRRTYLVPVAATAVANKVFIATATLRDQFGTDVPGQQVSFAFNGTTLFPVTSGVGLASTTFSADVATGPYSIPAEFAGTYKLNYSSTTLNLAVLRRPTTVTPLSNVTTSALDVFYATATLRDLDSYAVPNKALRFVFQGSTFMVTTDAFGTSVSTWAAPASSGTYKVYSYFDGDPLYGTSASTITVTVQQRPTAIALNPVSAAALDVFRTTATLTDPRNGTLQLAGRPVTFTFSWAGTPSTGAVTDAVGLATASYQATPTAGNYTLTGAFAGDATYASTSTLVALSVAKRSAFVRGVFVSTRIFDVFTASGTFYDSVSSAPVNAHPLSFSLQNVATHTITTAGLGSGTTNFTAPASSGTYFLNIWSPGDATYNATTVYASSVTLSRRNSRLTLAGPANVIINSSFTPSGTLFDTVSNATVPVKTLSFLFQASTLPAVTNGLGVATTTYTASLSSGPFALQVSFAGDASYNPSVATRTVTALRYPTWLAGPAITVTMNEVLTATATLSNYLAAPVPGKQLIFNFEAQPFLALTGGSGIAYSTYSAAVASGTYALQASFSGDALYDSTTTALSVLVNKRAALLTPDPVTVKALDVFTATATLSDLKLPAQKLAGATVRFSFFVGGSTITNSGVTNVSGVAVSTFAAPASTGTYQYRVDFTGNGTFYPAFAYGSAAVTARPVLLMQDNSQGTIDEPFLSTATLVDQATLAPIASRTVLFTFGSSSAAATGPNGKALAGFTAPASSGTFQLNSSFAGDATYDSANSTGTLTVLRRPVTPAAPGIAGIIDEVFTSTLTLSDALNADKVSGTTVAFVFSGATFIAPTDGDGVAVATFSAPSSSGTFYAALNFAGNARYLPNNTTAQLLVDRRPVGLAPEWVLTRAGEIFTATATLTDTLAPGLPPAGKPLLFVFQGLSFTALTGPGGVAVSTFMAPASSGTLRLDVSFAGDARYQASASSETVSVLRRLSAITIDPAAILALDVFTATATLSDKNNPVVYAAGRTLTFTFRAEDFASVTDPGGVAVSTFAGPASSGTYVVEAAFAGDAIYDASYSSRAVTVLQRPAALTAADGSVYPFETYLASASIRDLATGAPLQGRLVSYLLDGVAASADSSALGVATATYSQTPAANGDYELAADFAGDATYAAVAASATVSVMQRPTSIAPSDTGTIALEVFTASATLYDVRLATPVAGKEVGFTFNGVTSTAATDAAGLALADFSAPVSSGVYYYAAEFAGDTVYALASATGAVTVGTRETRVEVNDANANVGEPFTLTARLVDPALEDLPGYYVPGVPVKFVFKDRNDVKKAEGYATTNAVGVATITFSVALTPDVYNYTASFEGNYTYTASSAAALVKVGLLTSLVAFDDETISLGEFTAKAKLTDYLSLTLDDKPIRFRFIAAEQAGVTNAAGQSGIASSTFSAPASSGTYFYTAHFDGDSIYSASNATGTLVVTLRPSVVIPITAFTSAHTSFTATATLYDPGLLAGVSGRDIDFLFNGATITANTDGGGMASATFFAPFSSGTVGYQATFHGDDTYSPDSKPGSVVITLRPVTMLSYNVTDLLAASTFTARVQLKDAFNQPVQGLSVDLDFEGDFGSVVTDAQGEARFVFTAPASSGTYSYYATFYGDDRYAAANGTGTATVGPRPTILFTSEVSAKLGAPLQLAARLVDVNSQAGIAGSTVSFYFEGSTLTAFTDAFGGSSVTFAAPASTGTSFYGAEFEGDGVAYTGSSSSSPVTIALNLTTLDARSGLTLKIYEPLPAEATIRDSIGVQLQGLPVIFTFEGSSVTSASNEVGKATASFPTNLLASTGTYNYEAAYEGDTNYVASSDTGNVVNVIRRESLLLVMNAQATPSKNVSVEARFYDNVNGSALAGQPVPGKPVVFELNCGTYTQTTVSFTSVAGLSTAAFVSPASTGTFVLTARFADGDPVYLPYISTAALTVFVDDGTGAIRTKLLLDAAAAYIGAPFVASGTLTATDLPVPGKAILFEFFNGVATFTAAGFTDGVGLATAAFTAPASSGTYQLTASFAGDLDYSAAAGTNTLTALRYPDSLTAKDVVAYAGDTFLAKAVLRDQLTLAFISSRTVVFEFFNGVTTETLSALTSSTGSAEVAFVAPALAGDYFFTASFAGDAEYVPAEDTGSMLIASKGFSTFLRGYDVIIGTGEVFAASATLMTGAAYPVQGKPVTFTFQALNIVSTTNALGMALSTFTAPASSGTYVYMAVFSGDAGYNATDATGTISVVFRQQPEPPAFTAEVTSTTVTLAWTPVTVSSAAVASYIIEQSVSLRGGVTASTAVAASSAATQGYSIPVDENQTTFIKIKTRLDDNQQSAGTETSLIVEVPSKVEDPERVPNYYYMSPEKANGAAAWVKIPGVVMDKISASAPIDIRVEEQAAAGYEVAYNISAHNAPPELSANLKTNDRRGIKITLAYPTSGTGTSAISGQRALFWYNGVEWIKIGGDLDVVNREISTYSRVLGQFAVRAAPLAASFSFTKVSPRVFTPDEPDTSVNRARFYFENPEGAEVTIRIFDITGALVRRNLEYEGAWMFWNGKDQAGTFVKGGVYIYQVESGDKVITGTVVVAK
ncbi:MAG: hypothetical protein A2X32_03440 [Elusimicrobia bacterium GWC2_64_44]|nr:MAG: hypothetical protein A2X32_03440 [Elusimicrobia bacterium GWC2_64_44]